MKAMSIKPLLLMGIAHFIIMFVLMYSMVFIWSHMHLNINKAYMAAIMTAPMLMLETVMMRSMYENKAALKTVFIVSAAVLIVVFLFIRTQSFVADRAFLRSMIPHHSSAILMCEEADLSDTEIRELCGEIVKTQREEIAQMEAILKRLNE